MKKMGRPIKGNSKRDKRIEFRVSVDELNLINETAKKNGKSRADTVIQAVEELSNRLDN